MIARVWATDRLLQDPFRLAISLDIKTSKSPWDRRMLSIVCWVPPSHLTGLSCVCLRRHKTNKSRSQARSPRLVWLCSWSGGAHGGSAKLVADSRSYEASQACPLTMSSTKGIRGTPTIGDRRWHSRDWCDGFRRRIRCRATPRLFSRDGCHHSSHGLFC